MKLFVIWNCSVRLTCVFLFVVLDIIRVMYRVCIGRVANTHTINTSVALVIWNIKVQQGFKFEIVLHESINIKDIA